MPTQGFLQLADDAFFDPTLDLQPATDELLASGFEGLALDAPAAVELGARATLPVAALAVLRVADAWDWTFHEHTVLVASNLDRFRCLAAAVAPPRRPLLRPTPRPPLPDDDGRRSDRLVVDARRCLDLPWEPATWQLLLVSRDLRSSAARVTLLDGAGVAASVQRAGPSAATGISLAASAGEGVDTIVDVELKVRAPRAVFPPAPGGDVIVPVTFVVTGHARPAPYVGRHAARGRFGPPGEPDHVVATLRATLQELVPALAGAHGDVFYVWAFAGDQVGAPVRVNAWLP